MSPQDDLLLPARRQPSLAPSRAARTAAPDPSREPRPEAPPTATTARRSRRAQRLPWLIAAALSLVAVLALPSPTLAADDVVERATTTYELVPDSGLLRVTIDLQVTNHVPSTTRLVACTRWEYDPWFGLYPVPDLCPQTTSYYVDAARVWVEREARNLKISADRGTVRRTVDTRTDQYVAYKLTFARTFRNQTRKIRVSYEIPGGKPRTDAHTRLGRAYVRFCVTANGADGGSVRVIVPSGYNVSVWPGPMTESSSGNRLIFESGPVSKTTSYYRCLEGTNDSAYQQTEITSRSGTRIAVLGWPEDPEWQVAVSRAVGGVFDTLERLIGRPPAVSREITVREVTQAELGDYAGAFDSSAAVASISEAYDQPGLVAHELAHAWFNLDTFKGRWMVEGLAEWAARHVAGGAGGRCAAGLYPGQGSPDLDVWPTLGPRATDADRELVDYLYRAACSIPADVEAEIGTARTWMVVGALLDGRPPYSVGPTARRPAGPVDWRTLLDIVDEVGLVPAGVEDLRFAESLFLKYGIADPAALEGRAEARAAFHRLGQDLTGWRLPSALTAPLESWEFDEATARIRTARELLENLRAADAALPAINALGGPARRAFESAVTAADLAAAADIAAAQVRAAPAVRDAVRGVNTPRDLLATIGVFDVDLEAMARSAVAAVAAADTARATDLADQIKKQLRQAPDVGLQRAGVAALAGLMAVLSIGGVTRLVARRRRRADLAGRGHQKGIRNVSSDDQASGDDGNPPVSADERRSPTDDETLAEGEAESHPPTAERG